MKKDLKNDILHEATKKYLLALYDNSIGPQDFIEQFLDGAVTILLAFSSCSDHNSDKNVFIEEFCNYLSNFYLKALKFEEKETNNKDNKNKRNK